MSGSQAPVSLLNKGRGGVGRGLKPFAIREQPQPKITLERRAENCYLLPVLKLEAGRFECVCVCTHTPPPLPFVAGNHILSGPSIQQDPPSYPHFSPGCLKAAHFSERKKKFFACFLWWLQQQQHWHTDAHFLILTLPPSLAPLLLKKQAVPHCTCPHCWALTRIHCFHWKEGKALCKVLLGMNEWTNPN